MATFTIFYRHRDPAFGGDLYEMGRFNRSELREALNSFRRFAHGIKWDADWILKRGRKTIAKIHGRGMRCATTATH